MSVAPHAGIVDFGTFTSPNATTDGIQGEVPQPLAGQQDYVLTANGFVPGGSIPGLGTMAVQNANAVAITGGTINGTTIGATTPSTVNATTITGQTGVLRGTGSNLLLQSENFGTSWARFGTTTLTLNTVVAPNGTTTADNIVFTSASAGIFQSVNAVASTVYTFSIYIKSSSSTQVNIVINTNLSDPAIQTVAVTTGWQRFTISKTTSAGTSTVTAQVQDSGSGNTQFDLWGAQLELGSVANTYIPTTTTAVYGTPTLSFSGVSTIGLESNGALYVSPAGTGALQAQATTSTATGGNARGANAVDWQTSRSAASQIASGGQSAIVGGQGNTASGFANVVGGYLNNATGYANSILGGQQNTTGGNFGAVVNGFTNTANNYSVVINGQSNTAAGYYNFIGGGFTNSATSSSAVTTQSGTMNATTAVTLSGSNANIKVGQYITGTSISGDTYVAAISGTSLTLSKNASGSSTSTLSFFTPHGVVVGGGNNQATGSYSFIGGGGDAGTAANRNVASGDWSAIAGGWKNTASSNYSFVGGGGGNSATTNFGSVVCGGGFYGNLPTQFSGNAAQGVSAFVGAGFSNIASGFGASVVGGNTNYATSTYSAILGGYAGTTRGIIGYQVFPAHNGPVGTTQGSSQAALLIIGAQTTNATATAITSDGGAAGTTNQVILPNNSAYYFKGSCIANVTGAANGAAWSFEGAIMRGANAASTVLIDTPSVNRVAASSGATAWVLAITADTTNGGLRVTVTGVASTTIRWVAKVETTEVTF